MRRFRWLALLAGIGVAVTVPAGAAATTNNDESARYQLHMEVPNVAKSADGDTVSVTGEGEFSVHPKEFAAEGTFTLTNDGTTVSGTWTAVDLVVPGVENYNQQAGGMNVFICK